MTHWNAQGRLTVTKDGETTIVFDPPEKTAAPPENQAPPRKISAPLENPGHLTEVVPSRIAQAIEGYYVTTAVASPDGGMIDLYLQCMTAGPPDITLRLRCDGQQPWVTAIVGDL